VLPQSGGELIDAGGIDGLVKMDPAWNDRAPGGITEVIEPGRLIPAHTHADTAQWSMVLGFDLHEDEAAAPGEHPVLVFMVDGKDYEAGLGECIWREPGARHAVWNPGRHRVRQLEFNIGGDMFSYYRERAQLLAGGAGQEDIVTLARGYGLTFDPDLTRKLEADHRVSVTGPWR
jgi:hypothetical protein